MRTVINTYNLYSYNELSDDAKENAIQNYRETLDLSYWGDEMVSTIKAIAKAIGCEYDWYSYDGITYKVWFEPINFDNELCGKRAWAYIVNNFITPNEKPKTYWLNHVMYCDGRKNWKRKSKINYTIEDCPFTGYYADCCFYSAWVHWKKNFTLDSTIEDFLDILGDMLGKEWSEDNEYQYSDEGIEEVLIDCDYEFYEDGKIY